MRNSCNSILVLVWKVWILEKGHAMERTEVWEAVEDLTPFGLQTMRESVVAYNY